MNPRKRRRVGRKKIESSKRMERGRKAISVSTALLLLLLLLLLLFLVLFLLLFLLLFLSLLAVKSCPLWHTAAPRRVTTVLLPLHTAGKTRPGKQ
jgi:uncharacterized membrane protein